MCALDGRQGRRGHLAALNVVAAVGWCDGVSRRGGAGGGGGAARRVGCRAASQDALTDEEFASAFGGMGRADFAALPSYKRNNLKGKCGLFR